MSLAFLALKVVIVLVFDFSVCLGLPWVACHSIFYPTASSLPSALAPGGPGQALHCRAAGAGGQGRRRCGAARSRPASQGRGGPSSRSRGRWLGLAPPPIRPRSAPKKAGAARAARSGRPGPSAGRGSQPPAAASSHGRLLTSARGTPAAAAALRLSGRAGGGGSREPGRRLPASSPARRAP